jgi:hypothetical protein
VSRLSSNPGASLRQTQDLSRSRVSKQKRAKGNSTSLSHCAFSMRNPLLYHGPLIVIGCKKVCSWRTNLVK